MKLSLLLALSACADLKQAGGDVGGSLVEVTVCELPFVHCGRVVECDQAAENPLGHVEICIDDGQLYDVEQIYGACEPTPRHEGVCLYCCGDCGRGCNAFNGCFCPDGAS